MFKHVCVPRGVSFVFIGVLLHRVRWNQRGKGNNTPSGAMSAGDGYTRLDVPHVCVHVCILYYYIVIIIILFWFSIILIVGYLTRLCCVALNQLQPHNVLYRYTVLLYHFIFGTLHYARTYMYFMLSFSKLYHDQLGSSLHLNTDIKKKQEPGVCKVFE